MTNSNKSFLEKSTEAIGNVIRALENPCANKTADYENQKINKKLKTAIDYGDVASGLMTVGTIFNQVLSDRKSIGSNKSNKVNYTERGDIIKIVPNLENQTIEISDAESGMVYNGIKPDQVDFMIELVKFMIGEKNAISGNDPYKKKKPTIREMLNSRKIIKK